MIRILSETECRKIMEMGEFESSPEGRTALILTQSWCSQWKAMKGYLPQAEKQLPTLEILYIEYDQLPWFEEFMAFKENTFDNREIPYVRYYRGGKCTSWSNYVALEGFLHRLEGL
jgi:hypothetical protein